jgi:hypothetical protein
VPQSDSLRLAATFTVADLYAAEKCESTARKLRENQTSTGIDGSLLGVHCRRLAWMLLAFSAVDGRPDFSGWARMARDWRCWQAARPPCNPVDAGARVIRSEAADAVGWLLSMTMQPRV